MKKKVLGRLLPVAFLCGCAELQDHHADFVNDYRAWRAWHGCVTLAEHLEISDDYRKGWRDGYSDVLMGGSGNPPSVPPACYWSAHNQDLAGLQRIENWYNGFRRGAAAAQASPYWTSIPVRLTGGPCANGCVVHSPSLAVSPSLVAPAETPALVIPTPPLGPTASGSAESSMQEAPPAPAPETPEGEAPATEPSDTPEAPPYTPDDYDAFLPYESSAPIEPVGASTPLVAPSATRWRRTTADEAGPPNEDDLVAEPHFFVAEPHVDADIRSERSESSVAPTGESPASLPKAYWRTAEGSGI